MPWLREMATRLPVWIPEYADLDSMESSSAMIFSNNRSLKMDQCVPIKRNHFAAQDDSTRIIGVTEGGRASGD